MELDSCLDKLVFVELKAVVVDGDVVDMLDATLLIEIDYLSLVNLSWFDIQCVLKIKNARDTDIGQGLDVLKLQWVVTNINVCLSVGVDTNSLHVKLTDEVCIAFVCESIDNKYFVITYLLGDPHVCKLSRILTWSK